MTHKKVRDGEFNLPDLATLPPDGGKDFNRLVFSSSPYLLQHARNPVDWYPWGEEAFQRAQDEHKPVFLSIGYSTCHWCHVMEHESFEDPELAAFLNEHFISIKLDREERPDIDNIYMTVCQAMTGSGGWPLTVFMTPEKKPFFAGTYFPREDRFGRPGFLNLLQHLQQAWESEQEKIGEISEDITGIFHRMQHTHREAPDTALIGKAVNSFSNSYDKTYGGFGSAPKFPMAHALSFLLQQYRATRDLDVLEMAEHTLRAMYKGGLYDHVGFGFCRYSTDAKWLVPHFEKMLYDNALLMMAYADAYRLTGKPFYRNIIEEIFEYVSRELTDEKGGFYSAENADSEGEEGKFYVFTYMEFMEALGEELGAKTLDYYGVVSEGNFEDGKNILHRAVTICDWSNDNNIDRTEANRILDKARNKLFEYRSARVHPSRDDKILTNWNGLMIAALAKAGFALNDDTMLDAARNAADFVLAYMRNNDGVLLHRYRNGNAAIPAFVDDYAFLVWGLIELYQATFDAHYLAKAVAINRKMLDLFWDDQNGGLFYTSRNAEELIARTKDYYDGALPSGNSAAAYNCIRLARLTGDTSLEKTAEDIISAAMPAIRQNPTGSTLMLTALNFAASAAKEIVIAADTRADAEPLLAVLRGKYIPDAVVLVHLSGREGEKLRGISDYIVSQTSVDGRPAAYICEKFACQKPITSMEEFERIL